jgi:hypothetical protein
VWILTHPDVRFTARIKAFMQFMYRETEGKYDKAAPGYLAVS